MLLVELGEKGVYRYLSLVNYKLWPVKIYTTNNNILLYHKKVNY